MPHYALICASSHLTDFAGDTKVEEPLTNLPNPDQVGGLLSKCCADAWHIIAVLAALTMFNFFGIYFGLKSDERDFDMCVTLVEIHCWLNSLLVDWLTARHETA